MTVFELRSATPFGDSDITEHGLMLMGSTVIDVKLKVRSYMEIQVQL